MRLDRCGEGVHNPSKGAAAISLVQKLASKILAVALIFFAVGGSAFADHQSYVSKLGASGGAPIRQPSLEVVGLSQFHHMGLVNTQDGTGYCSLEKGIPSPQECKLWVEGVKSIIQQRNPEIFYELNEVPVEKREGGGRVTFVEGEISKEVRYLANPNEKKNQQAVLTHMGQVSEDPLFFLKSTDAILQFFRRAHELHSVGVESKSGEVHQPGIFRTVPLHVQAEGSDACNQTMCFPLKPEEVEPQMRAFIQELQQVVPVVLAGGHDGVAVAAWAHQEFARISPFAEHNGHIARALMNVLLKIGGEQAVVIPDKEQYNNAVVRDLLEPGAFVSYLEDVIGWNHERRAQLAQYGIEAPVEEGVSADPFDKIGNAL